MNLSSRVERLEKTARQPGIEGLPEVRLRVVEAVCGEGGRMRAGRCTGGLIIRHGGGRQWLDADMNPIDGPA